MRDTRLASLLSFPYIFLSRQQINYQIQVYYEENGKQINPLEKTIQGKNVREILHYKKQRFGSQRNVFTTKKTLLLELHMHACIEN